VEAVVIDLVEFLRAALDEDERVARAAIRPERIDGWANPPLPADSGRWMVQGQTGEIDDPEDWYAIEDEKSREIVVYNESRPDPQQATHIARHDPARVLAEVAAKRAILELFPATGAVFDEAGNFEGFQGRDCHEHRTAGSHRAWCFDCSEWCYPDVPCVRCHGVHDVLRLLAQPYAGRPGWREEWAT
jgi:hypothetical protein